MSGQAVAGAGKALRKEIESTRMLVTALSFQEAEDNLSKVDDLLGQLAKVVDPGNRIHSNILLNRGLEVEDLRRSVERGLQRREAGKREDGNIAFKCNWSDRGYRDVCSDAAYQYNKVLGGWHCLHSKCRQLVNTTGTIHDSPCYESRAFTDCAFGAGWDLGPHGELISPRTIRSAKVGKIALLTTIRPQSTQRLVIGAFRIAKVAEDPGRETFVFGETETLLEDMLQYEIKFWDYHVNPRNSQSTSWSTGLFRYISDVATLGIVEEYVRKCHQIGADVTRGTRLLQALKGTSR